MIRNIADPELMFKALDQITDDDLPRVGGKAFNCAGCGRRDFRCPTAWSISSDATDADVRQLTAHAGSHALAGGRRVSRSVPRASAKTAQGHSFAGIHETQLNVDPLRLVEAVLACRRSAASEQARAYRSARHIDESERDRRAGAAHGAGGGVGRRVHHQPGHGRRTSS